MVSLVRVPQSIVLSVRVVDTLSAGIGAMGFPMAHQLRSKIPASSTLIIREVVDSQVTKFLNEAKGTGPIKIAESAKAVALEAVGSRVSIVTSPLK
jgi:hypothetical protein